MVIWEKKEISVHELGDILYLDSGTLTPVLKKLEASATSSVTAAPIDERRRRGPPDREGQAFKEEVSKVPEQMRCYLSERNLNFTPDEITAFKGELYKMLDHLV